MTTACKAVWKLKQLPSGVLVFHVYSCILVFFFFFFFFDILSDLRIVWWCIQLTHLTLVCVVIKYHLVQVWQNLDKKKRLLAWRPAITFLYLFLFHSLFIIFSKQILFVVAALATSKNINWGGGGGGRTWAKSISAIGPKKEFLFLPSWDMHAFHMHKLKKICIPINHKLWSDRFFPVQSDGEHPRWQFEREDGQKDSERRVCDVPPHTFWSFSAICVTVLLFAFWPRTFTIELNQKEKKNNYIENTQWWNIQQRENRLRYGH